MRKVIEIDSQHLNEIHSCMTKHELQFAEDITPQKKAEPLEEGSLLHKVLELYDGLMAKIHDVTAETWQEVIGEHFVTEFFNGDIRDHTNIVAFCLKAGEFFALKMDIDHEEVDNVLFQFKSYTDFYKNDPWETLAVEEVGSKVLFENAALMIVYVGKMDRVVRQGSIIAPMDHKSSKRRGDVSTLSNQFIGYCYLMGVNDMIVDKVGFQKSLAPNERFQRLHLHINEARIQEWKENTIDTILNYLLLTVEDDVEATLFFTMLRERKVQKRRLMNLTSCDKYSGCIFKGICEADPESRPWIKERDYKIREQKWDVGAILEAK